MGLTGAGDDRPKPGNRNDDHIHNSSEDKDLNGAVAVPEAPKKDAQHAKGQAKDRPTNQTRGEKGPGHAQEAKNGNQRDEAEKCGGGDVALESEGFEEGHAIGDDDPSHKHEGEADSSVDAHAHRSVPQ